MIRAVFAQNPTLTVALALAAGMVAQTVSIHLRLPELVLLLATGVVLGPELMGLVHPQSLGDGLQALVGFAVAVVLFEGGLHLKLQRLRRAQRAIRHLVTLGALVTAAGAGLCARLILGWPWTLSALFGTLVVVTGPTVITPLLKRLRVQRQVATVLEAEGVLIDAIGAIIATVALEVVLSPFDELWFEGVWSVIERLGMGAAVGLAGGGLLALVFRFRRVIPYGLENVMALGFALLIFEVSNIILHESGIAAVTMAGIVVGNSPTYLHYELAEFKEQLTKLLIGMLFVLLAANVHLDDVAQLGWAGAATVAALILIVRPLNVAVSTLGSGLSYRERVFLAWIAPRGIVAAAIASLFAVELGRAGIEGGTQLQALVFLAITATVVWAATTGGLMARLLGLQRQSKAGWVILGANPLARVLASLLKATGSPVTSIDSDPSAVRAAESQGLRALHGNGLEERVLLRAEVETRRGLVALSGSPETNLLFAQLARRQSKSIPLHVQLYDWQVGVTHEMVASAGMGVLFGAVVDVATWSGRIEKDTARLQWWNLAHDSGKADILPRQENHPAYLPLVHQVDELALPVDHNTQLHADACVAFLIDEDRREVAEEQLRVAGWAPISDSALPLESLPPPPPPPAEDSNSDAA